MKAKVKTLSIYNLLGECRMNKYKNIFTPLTIKNMTIRNRVAMPPMGTNYGGAMGDFTEEHVQYYEKRAKVALV